MIVLGVVLYVAVLWLALFDLPSLLRRRDWALEEDLAWWNTGLLEDLNPSPVQVTESDRPRRTRDHLRLVD